MRQTKNKNLTKQILTLMLAFVMVFTGMGIGSWGVDAAWADENPSIKLPDGCQIVSEYNDGDENYPTYCYVVRVPETISELPAVIDDWKEAWCNGCGEDLINGKFSFVTHKECILEDETKNDEVEWAEKDSYDFYSAAFSKDNYFVNLYLYQSNDTDNPDEKPIEADKTKLNDLINSVTGENEKNWHRENDRYNGSEQTSTNGFWEDMQTALSEAKALFVDNDPQKDLIEGVTEKKIAAAYSKLKESKEKLIPITQANTTTLYEAIKNCPSIDEATFDYGDSNLNAYKEAKNAAQTLLDSLFTGAGEATAANTFAKQSEVEAAAEALEASYSDGKLDAQISTQDQLANFLSNAASGLKGRLLHDFTWSGYEPASTFRGSLDGNGHTLTIDTTYKGLVNINSGTIRNLTICGADLNSVSAICSTNKGTIENCHNEANFNNSGNENGKDKGTLCNINETEGIIRNCYNTGKLTGSYIGGICGQNYGLIENCFNTGLITSETQAGGIVWRNHNNIDYTSSLGSKSGTIKNCYNFNVMHHANGWETFYGSYIEKNLGPICGDNEKASTSAGQGKFVNNEGIVENGLYIDTIVSNKPYGSTINITLSDIYLAKRQYFSSLGAGTHSGYAVAGWTEQDSANTIFSDNTDYYVFYDKTNDHFIAVTFDESATTNIIDAEKPSDKSEVCSSAAGDSKDFYLVTIPVDSTIVKFKNTDKIVDYANGYTNRYLNAYQQLDQQGTTMGADYSRKFVGTAIKAEDKNEILAKVASICGADTATVDFVNEMLSGIDEEQTPVTPSENNIKVKFRLVGATLSTSGNYDVGKGVIDSQYITWLATKEYSLKDGSTVGDLLQMAIKESGMKTVGESSNYVSGIYAPSVLGNYYLAEFTNGHRSGWMYTVNGEHPSVGLNGYYLKDGDSVIWHYINDYSYECSDWFNDPEFPNLGNSSTWDPWLKVPDVNPTKDTPTVGNGEKTKEVTTTGTSGSSITESPTEVTVSGATATASVKKENVEAVLKQAKENKSTEIVLNVAASDTKGAETVKVQLDTATVKSVVSDTSASLTVKTENGQVSLDREALQTVVSEAKGTTITLEVVTVSKPTETQQKAAGTNGQVLQLTVKSGDKIISDFKQGKATVTVEISDGLKDKKVAAIHIAEDGQIEQMAGKTVKIDGKDYYIFETPHFSAFALVDADELGLEVKDEEANIVKIKELISDMSLKARSSKTSKKNIKVTLTVDKSTAAAIKEIEDMGYTVKYKYYRSTKKASKYQAKITKTIKSFTNTAGKKGTRYYYKARIQVYDKDGKLVAQTALKQCKYAVRTWTK